MKKTLLVLLMAGLLLISATACSNDTEAETGSETESTEQAPGKDPLEESETESESASESESESETETESSDIDEKDPEVTDTTITEIYVFSTQATIRKTTVVDEESYLATAYEGEVYTVTGQTNNWYQISLTIKGEAKVGFIAKQLASDNAIIKSFTPCAEPKTATVTASTLNGRSYPSAEEIHKEASSRILFTQDTVVTVIAEGLAANGDAWSQIRYTKDGVEGTCYVNSSYLKVQNETNTETETETKASTEA